MRKLISLLVLSLCCFAASAQPTSFGGITPGTTTREELKSLVKEPDKVGSEDYFSSLEMKQPEGAHVSGSFQGDVMYALEVSFIYSPELKRALIEKYGLPKIKVGEIRTVTCQNKLGGSFLRLDGREELR